MKTAAPKFMRIAAGLTALIGALVLFMATMIGHDKYREKLIIQPTRPVNGYLSVKAAYPQKIRDSVLLLEIKISAEKNRAKAAVVWNGREIDNIQAFGHHFIKIPRELFSREGNSLLLDGLTAGATVTILEIKNLYGFSTGLLKSVMVLPAAPSIKRLPWPLATLLAMLLLLGALFAPKPMALTSGNHWLRYVAWIVIAFFLAVLALPLFVSIRIFLGLKTIILLLAILYWPGIWLVLRSAAGFFQSRAMPWIKTKLLRLDFSPLEWKLLAALALAAIFVFFAVYRQRYVGAADWYGYYAESLLFRQGQLTMKTAFPPEQYPEFAPLGFLAVGNKIIPQYPPGFPLLLALFGLVGLEFYVNALCGALTILILYLILRNSVSRGMAVLYTLLWTFFPMTLWGSMSLMSDLPATLFILLTYYFFIRNKIFWSGVAFSYAVVIRPSTVLFFIIFLPLLFKKKKFWSFCFSAAIIGSLYGLYNWAVFGKPWLTGYGGILNDLIGDVFWHHFVYYGKTIFMIMTPLLLIPALLTMVRRKPYNWFYFFWLVFFWVFYSFWRAGADTWWYLRFLLPGLPALFILSASGMQDMRERLLTWKPRWQPVLNGAAVLLLLVMLPYFIGYAKQNLLFSGNPGEIFYLASKKVQTLVPPDSLVGSIETSGAIRLYTGLESFRWDQAQSLKLIDDFLKKGRPIYLLIEPWHMQHRVIRNIAATYNLKDIAVIPESMNMILSQVCLRKE